MDTLPVEIIEHILSFTLLSPPYPSSFLSPPASSSSSSGTPNRVSDTSSSTTHPYHPGNASSSTTTAKDSSTGSSSTTAKNDYTGSSSHRATETHQCCTPPGPTAVLLTCRTFYTVGVSLLYTHVRFRSARGVRRFWGYFDGGSGSGERGLCLGDEQVGIIGENGGEGGGESRVKPTPQHRARIPCAPRTVDFDLANDIGTRLFYHMHALFGVYCDAFGGRGPASGTDVHGGSLGEEDNNNDNDNLKDRGSMGRHPVPLDALRLRFNSHIQDTDLEMISSALMLVDPVKFVWTGPDPLHHFSIAVSNVNSTLGGGRDQPQYQQRSPLESWGVSSPPSLPSNHHANHPCPQIVPPAVPHLFHALEHFTRLRELRLTHIAFVTGSSSRLNVPGGGGGRQRRKHALPFPRIPSLERVYIGQATFLNPESVAGAILLAGGSPEFKLQEIRLVDAYKESIWGPRLRRSDIEAAALALIQWQSSESSASSSTRVFSASQTASDHQIDSDGAAEENNEYYGHGSDGLEAATCLVRQTVLCQAKSERIIGGDRVEFKANLI